MSKYAQILTFDEIDKIRSNLGKIVATSGGYDPIQRGLRLYHERKA
jgi:hypothetical protein